MFYWNLKVDTNVTDWLNMDDGEHKTRQQKKSSTQS